MLPTAAYALPDGPRTLTILGATGSIGTQTLDIVRLFPDRFRLHALTAHRNVDLLAAQARAFRPEKVVIADPACYADLTEALADTDVTVEAGADALDAVAAADQVDVVVAALVGFAGLAPTVAAVKAGKTVALANKEALVVAGALMQKLAAEHDAVLVPVDSEHSAIFQCLVGEPHAGVEGLILTASGGPFRTRDAATFAEITPAQALKHPNWDMGAKITIDSATMMNKGLEVIEARWLFDLEADRIDVLVHPQSIVHSLVTFVDGSAKAQLGVPDMKVPIQYALSFPERWPAPHERVAWHELGALDFAPPDLEKFPCLQLAFDVLRRGGTAPAVLNAANEMAVALFLDASIPFTAIPERIAAAVDALAAPEGADDLATLHAADAEARRFVAEHAPTP